MIEGKRWLDDAFACAGEADERARALALTGRGLIDLLAGFPEHSDEDLETAIEIFQRHDDVESLRLTYAVWAEAPAALGNIEEGRRRRSRLVGVLAASPQSEFDAASESFARGSWQSSTVTSKLRSGTTAPRRRASPGSTGRS